MTKTKTPSLLPLTPLDPEKEPKTGFLVYEIKTGALVAVTDLPEKAMAFLRVTRADALKQGFEVTQFSRRLMRLTVAKGDEVFDFAIRRVRAPAAVNPVKEQ